MDTETSISTEEAILMAARKVFEAKGFDGARMQEISDRAGINRALLHYYFRSKEKMFERIFDEALERFMPLLSTWDQDSEESWEWKLRRFISRFTHFLKENSMLFLLREIIRKPELLASRTRKYAKGLNKFVLYFERLKNENLIRSDIDTKYFYIIMHSLCSFPLMNAIVFSHSLRISPKEYDALMVQYPDVISDLLIQLLKYKQN
ncbi:MAG: TetR/AcrR family transcriptional regulator [Cyclobacteriaceae bacterium]|nr:TetR/AcrR family transcriptional regulator [Cyclobacteriaceae bacterium]